MLIDVVDVKVLDGFKLFLSFEDGKSGKVDISKIVPFKGVFKPLKKPSFFKKVEVNPDIGTICWENGADISPESLYRSIH